MEGTKKSRRERSLPAGTARRDSSEDIELELDLEAGNPLARRGWSIVGGGEGVRRNRELEKYNS